MSKKLTLKQIALELEVSISTVSKALRDSYEISEETREKVKAFAKLYNYRPNSIALSLKSRKTKTIGVIVPEIVHYFFSTVIQGIENVANNRGYQVMVCLSGESFEKEVLNMELLANGSIDGFILSVSKDTLSKNDFHHIEEVIDQGMPVVMFDRSVDQVECDKVIIDDVQAARKATQYLLNTGCRNPALITTVDYVNVGFLRTKGFLEALKNNRIAVNNDNILKIEDLEGSSQQIVEFLKDKDFDGILAVNEIFAVTALKDLQSRGKQVPKDVAVIAFTDGILSKYASPSLTSIEQHGVEMGEKAAEILIERLESKEASDNYETHIIEATLVKRFSTR
ncbi:MAG: LacI family DNA-binding transcriptional regulator [Flavobacteriaceae bacterium]|nr:LacI family DNA-binding transcriptional regulator [Flavobacteriaceae bacterium]